MKVVIIGGGIVGASCAYELSRRGAQVTVIEKDQIGMACSYGNAGWMTPCFAMPLPMPGLFLKSLKWLTNPESPLYIKPEPSLLLMKWLTHFMFAMNQKQAERAIHSLVSMSQVSLDEYKKLAQIQNISFEQKGLLMVSHTKEGVQAAVDEMNLVEGHGVRGKHLSPEEVLQMEPSLHGPLKGGVYFPDEAHAEPLKVVQALMEEARKNGARIFEKNAMLDMEFEGDKIKSITTENGKMEADVFVLATGSWSTEIARKLRLSIPILGGKGYALITPPLEKQPQHPIMLVEKKIAVTPRNGSLRIAGTLELVNQDFSITQRRVNAIQKGAREYLHLPEQLEIKELWRGLRPCTPDGVPLIGFAKHHTNLMLACGHQMLGLQSGMGTGVMVSDLIEGKSGNYDLELFSPDRF